ncbi:hypothetical protein [Bacillus benzoevorans]|uniref:Activator of HSP90 ATPase n=1 Tax=Bacillus benzoevorans TaxID=1456 RepID=A0A7X0LY37_9BACI|nr:hypothetical protein [Bacillus benzoevorans]MBB6447059.1 activator of HSP90 ATPase [Bacillus benzoevorans]
MDENKDYDVVIGKVPKKDKKGNDITSDKLGAGGYRRSDGTYSGVAYDLEIIDDKTQLTRTNDRGGDPKRYKDISPVGQFIIDVSETLAIKTAEYLTEYLTDKAITSFDQWLQNRKKKNKNKNKKTVSINTRKTKAQQILDEQSKTRSSENATSSKTMSASATVEFDNAYEQYTINMTSEEAQKELLDIFMLSVIRARKVWKILHANIVDTANPSGQFIEGKAMVERLSDPNVIGNINMILEKNPALLEEWESIALSEILGSELIINEQYMPIDDKRFRESLTDIPTNNKKR